MQKTPTFQARAAHRAPRGAWLGLCLVVLSVCWPQEAHLSGALSNSGVTRNYTIRIAELSYPIAIVGRQPSQEQIDAETSSWNHRLATMMSATDRWLAAEVQDGKLAPVDITQETAEIELGRPEPKGGTLSRPALVPLPHCSLSARNFSVDVRVALTTLPPPTERSALGKRLCDAILREQDAMPTVKLTPVEALHDDRELRLTLESAFSVPASLFPQVQKVRTEYFKKATDLALRTRRRFETEHPGVTIRRVTGLGEHAVRFSMRAPLGEFDLLAEVVVAPGVKRPDGVLFKNALYEDWRAAGLPMDTELSKILKQRRSR